jgi:hypothetical protein
MKIENKKEINTVLENHQRFAQLAMNKSQNKLIQNLVIFNGSGVVATFAFIGQTWDKCQSIPFYKSSLLFIIDH